MFLGIDLTSSERKPSAWALLDADGCFVDLGKEYTDADILALAAERQASTVAIDSPLGFPKGMCCLEEDCACRSEWPFKGRKCEREIIDRRISIYVTTKRTFIKAMVYRAVRLAKDLRDQGHQVIEVYPYASKVCLFGRPIPKKTTKKGLLFLRERLGERIDGLASCSVKLDHDLCDALVATHTAYLHNLGRSDVLGLEEEGQIVVPRFG